ncbi:transposable element Tcb2 transposase [Trichonephila clavipes]|nr:transposable element Tcb2 transposase [Trichonephila clavipes]
MTVPVLQSVSGLCHSRFTVWVSGAIDLREYHCSKLAWARKNRDWSVEDWNQVAWSDESRRETENMASRSGSHGFCVPRWNCTRTWWLNHGLGCFFVPLLGIFSVCTNLPQLNSEQGMKGHYTAPMNLTEYWTALANIWQVIPVERFQKLVKSMSRRVTAVIKARGGPTRY